MLSSVYCVTIYRLIDLEITRKMKLMMLMMPIEARTKIIRPKIVPGQKLTITAFSA